jgi:hypothetical protein
MGCGRKNKATEFLNAEFEMPIAEFLSESEFEKF